MTARSGLLRSLYVQVIIAVLLGVLVGWLWPTTGAALKPLGDGFIKLVKMIITPVIFLTVVTGIAGMRDLGAFGRIAAKALGYFIAVSTLDRGKRRAPGRRAECRSSQPRYVEGRDLR